MTLNMINRPYSESCDQNRQAILQVITPFLENCKSVLEIGSGTGQHAVYLAERFPGLMWQTSDLPENHAGIAAWIEHSRLNNVLYPIALDVANTWPNDQFDIIFSANTLHIMSAEHVARLFSSLPASMHAGSSFIVYGPFNYNGEYTSESNRQFDVWLQQRDVSSGIRNFDWLEDIGASAGLKCTHDFAMPANNRTLVWQKTSS